MASDDSRDPRVNPAPGDVLRKRLERMVSRVSHYRTRSDRVTYHWSGLTFTCTIGAWRKWARNTEVIAKGAENA